MHAQMGTLLLRQGEGGQGGEEGRAAMEKSTETATYPFMEDTKQCANGDALIHQAGLPQVLGQAHSHQLKQVGVPQLATKETSDEAHERRT